MDKRIQWRAQEQTLGQAVAPCNLLERLNKNPPRILPEVNSERTHWSTPYSDNINYVSPGLVYVNASISCIEWKITSWHHKWGWCQVRNQQPLTLQEAASCQCRERAFRLQYILPTRWHRSRMASGPGLTLAWFLRVSARLSQFMECRMSNYRATVIGWNDFWGCGYSQGIDLPAICSSVALGA